MKIHNGIALVFAASLAGSAAAAPAVHWTASWSASQQIPEPRNALAPGDLTDATLRQIVHLSIGGAQLRVHLSNAFGTEPLHVTSVHIAEPVSPAGAAIVPGTDTALTFSGAPDAIIPAGAEYVSDPVNFAAAPLSSLAVTMHIALAPSQQTGHPGSRATSYIVHGDQVSASDLPEAQKIEHWYQLEGVDVASNDPLVVALGDSITDGHGATTNGNDRWTDVLAARLMPRGIAIVNQGIGGNHLVTDGLGPNTLARFDRDVLAQPGVRCVILLEGINDLGRPAIEKPVGQAEHDENVREIIAAYAQIVLRAHAHDIRVIGATVMPFVGSDYYHPDAATEADRQAVNRWIRTPGNFDGLIDFDALVRDPARPDRLLPAYDFGDHLHPTPAGYAAMGNAIPLPLFSRTAAHKAFRRKHK